MKVKAQVSQIGHASLWSPKVKATNVKPATCDYLRAGDFWSAMIATLYLSGQFPDLSLMDSIKRSWNWRVKDSFHSVKVRARKVLLLLNTWSKFRSDNVCIHKCVHVYECIVMSKASGSEYANNGLKIWYVICNKQ